MLPGMDPKKMQAVLRQMGVKSENLQASKVVIYTENGNLIVENPEVVQITMQGQKSFQISGSVKMENSISEADIEMVMKETGCNVEDAKNALEKSGGDIAQAIMSFEEKE